MAIGNPNDVVNVSFGFIQVNLNYYIDFENKSSKTGIGKVPETKSIAHSSHLHHLIYPPPESAPHRMLWKKKAAKTNFETSVYEYLENNSLSRALFGPEKFRINLDWPTRQKICVGIARGLAFLREESRLKIVHRDIKGANFLLDRDLNPKISDFGLAKLNDGDKTHISTRITGTIGYIAPEYALWGYLTYKADIYSFGIVALELVSGKNNMNYGPVNEYTCLLNWACHLQQSGKAVLELVDDKLGSDYNKSEAERIIKVALLCTNATLSLRPTMSEVVGMLEGTITIPDIAPNATSFNEDLRFKAIRDHHSSTHSQSITGSQVHTSTSTGSQFESSSASPHGIHETNEESHFMV